MTYGISTIMDLNNNFILWVCIVSGGGVLIILSHVFEVIDMRIDNFNIVFSINQKPLKTIIKGVLCPRNV